MNSSSTNNEEQDNPESIWSNSSPIPDSSSLSPSTAANTTDIWASIPSSSTSFTGYHPAYLSNPPTTPSSGESSTAIDEFDPFGPTTTSSSSSSSQPPAASTTTTLLGTGVRKNSKLVLIDTDSEEEEEDEEGLNGQGESELELRNRLERQALELHERDKQLKRQQQDSRGGGGGGGGGFGFVGNMFKTLSSAATSPTSSRPSTPVAPLPRVSSRPPPPSQAEEISTGSPLGKPFASIASVFRSNPSTSTFSTTQPQQHQQQQYPTTTSSLISAIAGKGKEKLQPEITNEKQTPSTTTTNSQPTKKKRRRRKRQRQDRRPSPNFDFNKFLEQMRSRSADPIAKYLRSFLKEFSRKPPQSTFDQTRVVNDFLNFIGDKMRFCDPWKSIYQDEINRKVVEEEEEEEEEEIDEEEDFNEKEHEEVEEEEQEGERELKGIERAELEFELSMEAMEKLVMNRLWHLTFTPALDPNGFEGGMSPSGDLERDQVVRQRIRLFSWLEPKHLDLPIQVTTREGDSGSNSSDEDHNETEETTNQTESFSKEQENKKKKEMKKRKGSERGFIDFAASELRKMNQYKAPRDKLICVLNCCKVIFGLIRHVASLVEDQGADTFIPFLIFVVLQANPDHLVSNLQYIQRFRNPEKLSGEGGYYLSSLNAAISFIETLDASALSNIDQSEFETNVANAVKLLASEEPPPPPPPHSPTSQTASSSRPRISPRNSSSNLNKNNNNNDETSSALLISPQSNQRGTMVVQEEEDVNSERRKNLLLRSSDSVERAMSKPIGALARIFEQLELTANEITGQGGSSSSSSSSSTLPPPPPQTPDLSSGARPFNPQRRSYHLSSSSSSSPPPLQLLNSSSTNSSTPDPNLYAPSSISDAKISEQIERQEKERHEAKMNTLIELFSSTSSSQDQDRDLDQGDQTQAGREGGGGGGIEREVVEMVLWAEGGDVGRAVERLLEMV
ncbi:hypothetical protein JCM3765_007309 [Sporobolomyces pararoseus]